MIFKCWVRKWMGDSYHWGIWKRGDRKTGQRQETENPGSTNCIGDWPSTGREDHSCRKGY